MEQKDGNQKNNHEDFDENKKVNKYTVDFSKITNKIEIKVDSQILGSCTFTNHINYLCYMLYKKNDYNYEKYNKWYSYCKFLLRNAIYDEIIKNNKINQYNIYKYILDTDTNIKKNIHYESSVNKEIQHIKCSYQEDTLTPIDISKEELLKNLTYRDKLWNIYTGYDDYKIPDNIVLFINELFEFYKKIKFFDNGISYITPIMEFYKIVKNNKDINFDANINYIITSRQIPNEDNYGNNDEEEYGNFICFVYCY